MELGGGVEHGPPGVGVDQGGHAVGDLLVQLGQLLGALLRGAGAAAHRLVISFGSVRSLGLLGTIGSAEVAGRKQGQEGLSHRAGGRLARLGAGHRQAGGVPALALPALQAETVCGSRTGRRRSAGAQVLGPQLLDSHGGVGPGGGTSAAGDHPPPRRRSNGDVMLQLWMSWPNPWPPTGPAGAARAARLNRLRHSVAPLPGPVSLGNRLASSAYAAISSGTMMAAPVTWLMGMPHLVKGWSLLSGSTTALPGKKGAGI